MQAIAHNQYTATNGSEFFLTRNISRRTETNNCDIRLELSKKCNKFGS